MEKLSLSELVEHLDFHSDEMTTYYDPKSGKFVYHTSAGDILGLEEELGLEEDEEDEEDESELDDEFEDDRESRLEGMIALPSQYDIDEYSIMENFARELEAAAMSEALCRAIQGKGAFRRFKDTVLRLGIEQRWYAYNANELKKVAIDWCKEHDIEYDDDIVEEEGDFSEVAKDVRFYEHLEAAAAALVEGESDPIANAANLSALLFDRLEHVNWVGFYFLQGDTLVVGPFQGKPACVRIALGKGVCGKAAAERKSIRVPDVHKFPGHIACDSASNSELVVPLLREGKVLGVLDLDSPLKDRFDAQDQAGLERIAAIWVDAGKGGRR